MAVNDAFTGLHGRGPRPTLREFAKVRYVVGFWFHVPDLPCPIRPPLLKNPLKKLFAGFVGAAFAAGQGGFGFYEAAFDGGFEDGGFVAFEVGFDALARELLLRQRCNHHGSIQESRWTCPTLQG